MTLHLIIFTYFYNVYQVLGAAKVSSIFSVDRAASRHCDSILATVMLALCS